MEAIVVYSEPRHQRFGCPSYPLLDSHSQSRTPLPQGVHFIVVQTKDTVIAPLRETARSTAGKGLRLLEKVILLLWVAAMIVRDYKPLRIYQWGSLLEDRHFSEISDIDIAVEGITDADAEQLTCFPLDIVAIEHVHPAYAEHIRRRGRIVHER